MTLDLAPLCRFRRSRAARFAVLASLILLLAAGSLIAQTDSSRIGPDGTAYVTRVVPVPSTVSPEAQRVLARVVSDASVPQTLAERRSQTDEWQNRTGKVFQTMYPVKVEETVIAGVPVRVITPMSVPESKADRVLINLHGGGFNSDSGSLTESIPVAYLSQTKVIAVLYRLAPEHPFPAALDDALGVYRELLKTHKSDKIGIFGDDTAGAILTGELGVRSSRPGSAAAKGSRHLLGHGRLQRQHRF